MRVKGNGRKKMKEGGDEGNQKSEENHKRDGREG